MNKEIFVFITVIMNGDKKNWYKYRVSGENIEVYSAAHMALDVFFKRPEIDYFENEYTRFFKIIAENTADYNDSFDYDDADDAEEFVREHTHNIFYKSEWFQKITANTGIELVGLEEEEYL